MTMRLYLHSPAVAFAARVNQSSFIYPIGDVTYDNVTAGAYTGIESGMTVIFGTSPLSDDLGRQRVRGATSTVLSIGRSSQGFHDGEVDLADNAYITVWNDHRVWTKPPYIDPADGTIYKDWDISFTDQTDQTPPVANAGVTMAGTINSITDKLRVQLPGATNNSFATADGASISTYAWTLPSGISLVGGYALSDAIIQVDCDPGVYYVKLTVTDTNGKSHSAYTMIFARDPDDDDTVPAFFIENHRIAQNGQSLSVRILSDIPASIYPDGTAVVIWEDEPTSPENRQHIVFSGWHHYDPASIRAERTGTLKDTVLECLDVAGKLATLPGFPQSIENVVGAGAELTDSWIKMTDANMDKYLHYLLYWHSTVLEVADWLWSNTGSNYPFVVLGSDAQSLYEQVDRRAQSLVPNHRLTCDTQGRMYVLPDPMLQDTADRTAVSQLTLSVDRWTGLDWTHQRPPRTYWLRGEAILAHATEINAVFCIAPGNVPGARANRDTARRTACHIPRRS